MKRAFLVLGLLAALACSSAAEAQTFTAKSGEITLTMTIPPGVTKLRGILAFTETGLGPSMAAGADFQGLAKRLSAGIVKVAGGKEFGDATYPTRCMNGEFKWVLDAVAGLAKASNHPELTNAPIAGHGHSHGGDYWNYFNACYPDRMAYVFCKSSGGVQYSKGSLTTPMIWEIGTNDLKDMRGIFRGAMFAHREAGTAMTLVLGPGEAHPDLSAGSRQMVIDIAEAVFNLRVPADVDTSQAAIKLYQIDEKSGRYLLGDNYSKEYAPYAMSPDKDMLSRTSFLPNEDVAKKWKAYGAQLPASIMVDKGGHCSTCYKTPAGEPDMVESGGAPPAAGAGTPPGSGSEADAGAGGSMGAGGATGAGGSSNGGGGAAGGSSEPTGGAGGAPSDGAGGSSSSSAGSSGSSGGSAGTSGAVGGSSGSASGGSTGSAAGGSSGSSSDDAGSSSSGGCSLGAGHDAPAGLGVMVLALGLAFARARRRR